MTRSKKQAHLLISQSGLRKVAGPPESSFKVIVVDQRGRPVSHLTEWYRQRQEPGPDRTRQTYLGMLLPVMGFFLEQGYAWNDSPERVRIHLVEFLRERVACRVQPDQDREGYWIETSGTSPLSKSGLGVLLAAMKDFYRLMTEAGYYPYPNPLNSQLLEQWRRERARLIAHAGAPDQAGIRSESWRESRQHPVAYFRQGNRKTWKPKIVLESQETREHMQDTLLFMTNHAPTQRDKVILLLLRHTGARLHEILGMTAGGSRKALDPLNAYVVNKGSLGREEKLITFLDTDEAELAKYIRTERARYDPSGRTRLEELADTDPLFLSARRRPYTDSAFRYHWNRLMGRAKKRYKVAFTPHAIRHLYVTQHLVWIKEEAPDDKEEQRNLKAALVHIMGWHSRETMRIYDHTFSLQEAVQKLHSFQKRAENRSRERIVAQGDTSDATYNVSEDQIVVIDETVSPNAFAQLWEELA
jgi:site-specific recombinase XerD